jgi:hypothetical protein
LGKEVATTIDELVATNPISGDPVGEGYFHVNTIKTVMKNTWPGYGAPYPMDWAEINFFYFSATNPTGHIGAESEGLLLGPTYTSGAETLRDRVLVYNNTDGKVRFAEPLPPLGTIIWNFLTANQMTTLYPESFADGKERFALCDGVATYDNTALGALIGAEAGENVPDLRERFFRVANAASVDDDKKVLLTKVEDSTAVKGLIVDGVTEVSTRDASNIDHEHPLPTHSHKYWDVYYRENNGSSKGYGSPGYGQGASSHDYDNRSLEAARWTYGMYNQPNVPTQTTSLEHGHGLSGDAETGPLHVILNAWLRIN